MKPAHPFVGRKVLHNVAAVSMGATVVRPAEVRDVKVMAVADGYAMVRRPGRMPYVVPLENLSEPTP